MHPVRLAEVKLPVDTAVYAVPGVGWMAMLGDELTVFDDRLRPALRVPLPAGRTAPYGPYGVARDGSFIVIATVASVLVMDHRGRLMWELGHPRAARGTADGACLVDRSGRVWAVVSDGRGNDKLLVLDPNDRRVVAVATLTCTGAATELFEHPYASEMWLAAAEGQDGSQIICARLAGDRLTAEPTGTQDRALVALSADARHYLSTPHLNDELSLHDLATHAVIAQRRAPELPDLGESSWFNYTATYADAETIIASVVPSEDADGSYDEHVLLSATDLTYVDRVDYGAPAPSNALRAARPGQWLNADWYTGRVTLWALR